MIKMKISTNQFKNGTKLLIDNAPCSIIEHEFHKPGKGQAVMRVKYKNLLTGNTNDKTFKSGESVETADVNHKDLLQKLWQEQLPNKEKEVTVKL